LGLLKSWKVERELKEKLNELGYKHIFFERGHKLKFQNLYVKIAIASKIKCRKLRIRNFPVENEMGGGGGIIHCYFPSLKTNVICIHFANHKKIKLYRTETKFLQNYLKKLKNKLVLMGDFNLSYKKIKNNFKDFQLVSGEIRTCSITPFLRWFSSEDLDHIFVKDFSSEDLDHIFVKDFKGKRHGSLEGYSDHKLVWADLK